MDTKREPLTLLIMAAGVGKRFGGLKQLEGVGPSGETFIDYSLEDSLRLGFDKVVLVIREETRKMFDERIGSVWSSDLKIDYVYQKIEETPVAANFPGKREKPWGTTHAVWSAREKVDGPFAVINADDYYGRNSLRVIRDFLREDRSDAHALVGFPLYKTFSPHGSVSRGVCKVSQDGSLADLQECLSLQLEDSGVYSDGNLREDLTQETLASMNLWGFRPSIFAWLESALAAFLRASDRNWAKDECLLPLTVIEGIRRKEFSVRVLATKDEWLGITYREDLDWVKQKARLMGPIERKQRRNQPQP